MSTIYSNIPTTISQYLPFFTQCKNLNSLRQIHGRLIILGISQTNLALTHLINTYSLFQKCEISSIIFNYIKNPDTILYNSMIRAYNKSNQYQKALELYNIMSKNGINPDKYTYTFVINACAGSYDFNEGVKVHNDVIRCNMDLDVFISTGLVDMYCKLDQIGNARKVFDKMPKRDIVSWNTIIGGLSKGDTPDDALECFRGMQLSGVVPNSVTLLNLLPAVCDVGCVRLCRSVHGFVVRRDFRREVFNGLIDMYSKCGFVECARRLFDRLWSKDRVSWGTMMSGYSHNGYFHEVLELFDEMRRKNTMMNKVSAVSSLQAVSEFRDLVKGKEIHDCAIQYAIDSDIRVSTALLTMYLKCGDLQKAKQLFSGLREKDAVAWSALIAAYEQSGCPIEAITLFREMVHEKFKPSSVTLLSVFPVCVELSLWKIGKSIHCYSLKAGIDLDVSVGNSLISMYTKCELFTQALTIFNRMPCKNVVSWNSLISGYAQSGRSFQSLKMFHHLLSSGTKPDDGTMVGVVSACSLSHDLHQGANLHGLIIKSGLSSDCHVKNALIDMYSKSGKLLLAETLFDETDFTKDEVSWNAMITCYVHNGHPKKAISSFCRMKSDGLKPSAVSIVSVLPATADLTAITEGMMLHACTIRMGFQSNTLIGNGLIDMYAKCGRLEHSEQYFREMKIKDTVSWNTMLASYALHGQATRAVWLFSRMQEDKVMVDAVSFLSVLSACRHGGLLEDGRKIFNSMADKLHIEPKVEHYACMVDLLGRNGLFTEIMDLIEKIPVKPDAAVWGALLGACRVHSNLELAEIALNNLVKIEPENAAHYVGLSNIYAQSGRWVEAKDTRLKLNEAGLIKVPGQSWV